MRGQKALLVTTLVLLLLGAGAWGCGPAPTPTPTHTPTPTSICPRQEVISCEEAKHCIGEYKTVQGIYYVVYKPGVSGQPTFSNCPTPYPDHDFTALIWGDKRQKFIDCLGGLPEALLDKQEFGVNGLIEPYGDKVEIILTECDQLRPQQ